MYFQRANVMIIFNGLLLVTTAVKLMIFMSVVEKFSLLANMLIECMIVIIVFLFFMYIWIMTFTFMYSVIGIEFGDPVESLSSDGQPPSAVSYVFEQFVMVYHNTLGEIQPLSFPVWDKKF